MENSILKGIYNMTFDELIITIINSNHLTKKNFRESLGPCILPKRTLNSWLSKKHIPNIGHQAINEISKVYNIPINVLENSIIESKQKRLLEMIKT